MPTVTKPRAKKTKTVADLKVVVDPQKAADEAGLRYVNDKSPGYTRKRKGDDFEFLDTQGAKITDEARVLRIRRIAIPPAWENVWICPRANGHIQATGCDVRRRKQYRYHERWREVRDEGKYEKMVLFGTALPKIRRRVTKDLALPGLAREKVLATVVQLLERTFIRVGNEEYAKENKSFGLTTMRNRHIDVSGATMRFQFRGKSGVSHDIKVEDRRVAKVIRKLQDLPGQDVFQYVDDAGEIRNITSQDVNDYLREITGEEFTAKDFRTWAGTVLAAMALHAQSPCETKGQAKKNVRDAISAVSKILGNTPAVCRKCYVHPAVLENYLTGTAIEGLKLRTEEALADQLGDLRAEEAAVMAFLQARLAAKK